MVGASGGSCKPQQNHRKIYLNPPTFLFPSQLRCAHEGFGHHSESLLTSLLGAFRTILKSLDCHPYSTMQHSHTLTNSFNTAMGLMRGNSSVKPFWLCHKFKRKWAHKKAIFMGWDTASFLLHDGVIISLPERVQSTFRVQMSVNG